ncbi:NADH-quinone oxidoreductase subunit C 1 [bacterium BMS3Abin05]|nr:NADH-quinone oxidoreductase subunit C 1 [bacterium BMS3Abin05]GBE26213.1 NADH-quinone oxidoreductase subunit C 1 [bacterium BMS3Bbin03]HDZ11388.1 NADH-quinone oxidoreductase subunit C [Bacteroidota bacterium]
MGEEKNPVIERVKKAFSDQFLGATEALGEVTISVKRDKIVDILGFLKEEDDLKFEMMMDLCGVDYLEAGGFERFAVVYHLYSMTYNRRLRIKAFIPEGDEQIDSVISLWAGADWPEREVFDMFGITINHHPDLRRILCPDDFEGHPLRKEFPVEGTGYRGKFEKITRDMAQ